jgi:hypothetical protein
LSVGLQIEEGQIEVLVLEYFESLLRFGEDGGRAPTRLEAKPQARANALLAVNDQHSKVVGAARLGDHEIFASIGGTICNCRAVVSVAERFGSVELRLEPWAICNANCSKAPERSLQIDRNKPLRMVQQIAVGQPAICSHTAECDFPTAQFV